MKTKHLILFILLISTTVINGQVDFRKGYVIQTNGDTLYGKIDYRSDLIMSNRCIFKDENNAIIEYTPNEIAAFRFTNSKYYISRKVNGIPVFLEYLINGKINIYYMRDEIGDHYYLAKEDAELTEIHYSEGERFFNNKLVAYQTTKHIGILNYYMQDASNFQSRIESVKKPDHYNLVQLAEDYHNRVCDENEKCIIYEKEVPLIKISVAPFIGMINYKGSNQFVQETGGYLYFWAPRANEKLYFKTGLVYSTLAEDEAGLNVFKIPLQFQYIYRAHKIQPEVSIGTNILIVQLGDYNDIIRTLSLNAGLNYMVTKKLSLFTALNSDFTTLMDLLLVENLKFSSISHSFNFGLRVYF